MADVETSRFGEVGHQVWESHQEDEFAEEEEGVSEEGMERHEEAALTRSWSQADRKGALDQRIARALGNLDKVVNDPTRIGAMAGDYGSFLPGVLRGTALPQSFIQGQGIDIPSLGPQLKPAPSRETAPAVSESRPKTAIKKASAPNSMLLMTMDPSLALTNAERPSKPLKIKATSNGLSKVLPLRPKSGEPVLSPRQTERTQPPAPPPPLSPLSHSLPTPSSTASTPERSPASILRIMTASALPSGTRLSPLGDLIAWARPCSSRLGVLQETDEEGAGAERGKRGRTVRSPTNPSARKELDWGKKAESPHKKCVDGKKSGKKKKSVPLDNGNAEGVAALHSSKARSDHNHAELDALVSPIASMDAEVRGMMAPAQPRQGGTEALMHQLSVDVAQLEMLEREVEEPGALIQQIRRASLDEIQRLKRRIASSEEEVRRRIAEENMSESPLADEGVELQGAARVRKVREAGDEGPVLSSRAQITGQKGGKSGSRVDGQGDEGMMGAAPRRQEVQRDGTVGEKQQRIEEKRRKRQQLEEELAQVQARQGEYVAEPRAVIGGAKKKEDGQQGKRRVEEETDADVGKEASRRATVNEGAKEEREAERTGQQNIRGGGEEPRKVELKKQPKVGGVSIPVPASRDRGVDGEKDKGRGAAMYAQAEQPSLSGKPLMKKKKKKVRDRSKSPSDRHERGGLEDKARRAQLDTNGKAAAEVDARAQSRAIMAAAREALPEADQQQLRQAAATAKMVRQAQVGTDVVPLGPRAAAGDDEFVGCDNDACQKWRLLPYWLYAGSFENIHWTCDMVDWLDKDYQGCHVDEETFNNQTKLINYPPKDGWEAVAEDIKKRGLVAKAAQPVASPTKPKRSVFQQRLQQKAEVPGKLVQTHSAGHVGEYEGGAGSPLKSRKRLLKEGEVRRPNKVRAKSRGSDESESGDEEWGGLTKGKKKKKAKKRRAVLSDDEEDSSDEDAGPKGEKRRGASGEAAGVGEEKDWIIDEEPSKNDEVAGGDAEATAAVGEEAGQAREQPQSTAVAVTSLDRREGKVGVGRKEEKRRDSVQKRKLDDGSMEHRVEKQAKRADDEGRKGVEDTSGREKVIEVRQKMKDAERAGREDMGHRVGKKKKKRAADAAAIDSDAVHKVPGLKSNTVASKEQVRVDDGSVEKAERGADLPEAKRRKVEEREGADRGAAKVGGMKRSSEMEVNGGGAVEARRSEGEVGNKKNPREESDPLEGVTAKGQSDAKALRPLATVVAEEEGEPAPKPKHSNDVVADGPDTAQDVTAEVDTREERSKSSGEGEGGSDAVRPASDMSGQKDGRALEDEPTGGAHGGTFEDGVTDRLVVGGRGTDAPKEGPGKEEGAGLDEHPFLEKEIEAVEVGASRKESSAAGARAERLARVKSMLPRAVLVSPHKLMPKGDGASGKGMEQEARKAAKVAGLVAREEGVESGFPTKSKEHAAVGMGPGAVPAVVPPEVAAKPSAPAARDMSSDAFGAAAEAGATVESTAGEQDAIPPLAPEAADVGARKGERRRRPPSSSPSSSDVSSSDLSSDTSELAHEEVVQPGHGVRDSKNRATDGQGHRNGEPPTTSRSTVLQEGTSVRSGASPLRVGRAATPQDRDSPPPSRAGRRNRWDERDSNRNRYRSERWRSPDRRGTQWDRERVRYDERDRARGRDREWEREYDRGRQRRAADSPPPPRERRGGSERIELERRGSRVESKGDGARSRSRSVGQDAVPPRRDSKGDSRQLSPLPEVAPPKDSSARKLETRMEAEEKPASADSRATAPQATTIPQAASGDGAPVTDAKVATPQTAPRSAPAPPAAPSAKSGSDSNRVVGSMPPPPPPAAASGAAALPGYDEAYRLFQKLLKEAKSSKHAADKIKAQSIAATVYLDAALKFLLAASSFEAFDAKQASSIYRETADYLEGQCVGSFRANHNLPGEALAWKCGAVARTRALHAVKDRALKDRAGLQEALLLAIPTAVPGAVSRPFSAGAQAAAGALGTLHHTLAGTPPGPIVIVESPSSSSASEVDAAAALALSLDAHQREAVGSMLHVVHEHFAISTSWTRAASLSAQAAKTLESDALSALNAVGENGGVGSLDNIVQAARIALDKFGG